MSPMTLQVVLRERDDGEGFELTFKTGEAIYSTPLGEERAAQVAYDLGRFSGALLQLIDSERAARVATTGDRG